MAEADRTPHSIRNIIHLAEPDYAFGAGVLHLRVDRVDRAHPQVHHGEAWYQVEGMQLTATGVELCHRDVLVRGQRLQSSGLTSRPG